MFLGCVVSSSSGFLSLGFSELWACLLGSSDLCGVMSYFWKVGTGIMGLELVFRGVLIFTSDCSPYWGRVAIRKAGFKEMWKSIVENYVL